MARKIEGRYFENCSCDVPCPCTVSLDFGADRDRCIDFAFEGGSAFANPFSWAA